MAPPPGREPHRLEHADPGRGRSGAASDRRHGGRPRGHRFRPPGRPAGGARPAGSARPRPGRAPSRRPRRLRGDPARRAPASPTANTTRADRRADPDTRPALPGGYWRCGRSTKPARTGRLPAGDDAADRAGIHQAVPGVTEIDTGDQQPVRRQGAHIGVGYRNPAGQPATAAVLHLLQVRAGRQQPWEVVGSGDTTFTLEQPGYGSAVSSPTTVGGRITGVDENIRVTSGP